MQILPVGVGAARTSPETVVEFWENVADLVPGSHAPFQRDLPILKKTALRA